LKYLILIVLLVGCTTAQSLTQQSSVQPLTLEESYPIEEAYADEGWTRLERTLSTGEAITFLIPSTWTPQNLKDIGNLNITIDRDLNSSTITLKQEN